MNVEKIDEVLRAHAEWFRDLGIPPRKCDTSIERPSNAEALQHAHWMALEAVSFTAEEVGKKNRWLGFVQGTLWVLGWKSIDAMREMNRP